MEKIAIIGSGLIGRAWAMVFARAGHQVKMYDAAPGAVSRAIGLVEERHVIRSRVPEEARVAEYDVVLVGKPTDPSGFGGATFASRILDGAVP